VQCKNHFSTFVVRVPYRAKGNTQNEPDASARNMQYETSPERSRRIRNTILLCNKILYPPANKVFSPQEGQGQLFFSAI